MLELVVTPYERRTLTTRAAGVSRIIAGKRSCEITRELWLSPQTISTLKKALREKTYRSYRERGKTERKAKVYHSDKKGGARDFRRKVRTKYGPVYLP
jgi:hypothetical protein